MLWEGGEDVSDNDFTTENETTLVDLPPYANVTVQVAAATEKGFGNATTCTGITPEDGVLHVIIVLDVLEWHVAL